MKTVRITRLERHSYLGTSGYYLGFYAPDQDEFWEIVEAIKGLPFADRKFMPDAPGGKCWWVSSSAILWLRNDIPGLEALVRNFGTSETRDQAPKNGQYAVPAHVQDAFTELYLLPTAPASIVAAAYRALAKLLHPDIGGNTKDMQRLNNAYEVATNWSTRMRKGA